MFIQGGVDFMKSDKEEFKYLIYELLSGARNLEDYPVEESKIVRNEFEEGMFCSDAYEEVNVAKERLYEKLNTNEDKDIECIISNLLDIAEHLSMRMYDYGETYARKTDDCDIVKIIYFYESLSERKKVKFMKFLSSVQELIR